MIEMEIMTCEKFNKLEMQKWHKAARQQKRTQPSLILPSINYGIRNKNGLLKKLGFVLFGKDEYGSNRHYWFKTKKEAVVKKREARLAEINA